MHPFVRRAISVVLVGRPKPLWYETVVESYPPATKYSPRVSVSTPKQTIEDHIKGGDLLAHTLSKKKLKRKLKSQMTLKEKEFSHWARLYRSPYCSAGPSSIKYEEDGLREELLKKYPFEMMNSSTTSSGSGSSPIDPHSPSTCFLTLTPESVIQRQLYLIKSDGIAPEPAHEQAMNEYQHALSTRATEEKLAREHAIILGHCTDSIDPEMRSFVQCEQYTAQRGRSQGEQFRGSRRLGHAQKTAKG